jgi:hypothetical protein
LLPGLSSAPLRKKPVFLPWEDVIDMGQTISVSVKSTTELSCLNLREGEMLLKDALLDKQVVNTDGAKIRRVNDLQFLKTRLGLHLVHIDVGFRGLIRRVGLVNFLDVILQGLFDYKLANHFIPWKFKQPLNSPAIYLNRHAASDL